MTQYVVWIQWGVVGFFALLHFIIGFKRGAKKSLFYSVLSVILMVLVLFLISFISVRPFLSDANLIKLVERFTSLPESVRASILDNPDSLAVIYALVDLVVKLVAFFVIYPIVKWLLTLIIGLPIWRNYEKTKGHPIRVTHIDSGYSILAKNVSGFQVEYKKSVLGRFAGGFFGFLRGALVGLLLLLPIAVMAGFIKGSTVANTEGDELTASNQAAIPEDIQGWLEVVEAFNNSPIGALYNKPHIGNKTLGEATFDLVINSKIKYQDKKQEKVKFTEEFGPIVKAAISLYQNGYLDDGFDLMEISQENLPDIEMLFKAINSSKLVTGIIPTAGPVGVVYFLDSQGFDVNAHPHAENALKEFSNINFKDELDTVYQIIEKLLLTIDNVGELSKFADINYLLETTIEKRTGLAEVLELVDGINSTVLISLVLDYVVTLPEVQEHISWLPNGTETEDYLREALDFYLDNPRFMQEDELFTKIAKIVRVLLVDKASYGAEEKEAGKKYLDYLYDSIKNPNPDIEAVILKYKDKIDDVEAEIREQLALEKDLDPSLIYQSEIDALLVDTIARFIDQAVDEMERVAYRDDLDFVVRHYNSEILAALLNDDDLQDLILDEKTSQMVVDVLEAFVDINTIMEALPLLVDYAIFVQFGDDLSAVSEELSASLKETDWRKDISTLGDVYHKITSFGLKKALRDEKYGPLIDKLISENKLDLDDIIDRLLVESHAINKIISITAPILVDKFVEDDDLKDGILELIKDFDGEKFEYGLELKRVLNAAVEIQKVIPFEELLDLGDLDEDQIIGIIKSFAGLDDDEYQNLKDAITELQVVKRFNKSLFVYLQKTIESDFLAIPEEELPSVFALDRDLTRLLDIVRSVAVTMDKELVDGASYKDINLANVLAADEVKENLEFKKADKDGLLYLLAVHNIVALNNNEGLQDFVAIPEKLISLPYREEVWRTEINTVISALIGTISLYAGDDTPFVLSLNNVSDVGNNWKDLDKTVLTKLIDNYDETLATFFDSKIVLASVTKTLETQLLPILNDLIKDYQASLPVDILDEDNYVTETAINELFEVLFDIVNQYIEFMNVSQLGDFVSEKEISEYLNFYNNLNVETVEDLAYAKFINGFFRDILADEAVWAFITEIIAEALPADLVGLDVVYFVYALEDERVKEDELFYLLGGLRDLKIDPRLLGDDFDMNVVFEYLDSIENTQLASFLRSNLLIELITNALNDPVIEDYAIKLVSDIITNLKEEEINAGTSLDKRIWTEFELDFDSLFASIRRINDQLIPELFDRNEFIRLFNAAKAFLETDINYEDINLALIPQLKEVLYDEKSTIDWLSEVRLIGSVLGEVLTQEGLLEWYADVVNKMLVIDGEQLLTIYNSDFSLFANYVDEKGHLKPEVISSLLTAGAALDWELISDDKITTKAFVDSFLQPAFEFSTNEQDRVYYLYQISFLEEAIESVIESQRFNNLLLEQINKLIDDNLPADANFSHFTKEDLDLNYNLFDEEATRQIFIAIEALKFDDFDELTKLEKIADIARILDLDNTKEITKNIFEIPLVEHLLRVVLTYEDLYILASDMLNDILSEAEIDFIVKPRHLMINEDYLTAEEYTNLVLAVYLSGYDIGVEITPAFIKALEEVVTYDGVAQTRLEHILEANIIYGYVDKYV
ncbi:MAG: hypothetical protein M0P92_02670, partial [Acholeplasmataceae bacterium]|nr:hypothetical protein [Acholeplasmataceae bacterium]